MLYRRVLLMLIETPHPARQAITTKGLSSSINPMNSKVGEIGSYAPKCPKYTPSNPFPDLPAALQPPAPRFYNPRTVQAHLRSTTASMSRISSKIGSISSHPKPHCARNFFAASNTLPAHLAAAPPCGSLALGRLRTRPSWRAFSHSRKFSHTGPRPTLTLLNDAVERRCPADSAVHWIRFRASKSGQSKRKRFSLSQMRSASRRTWRLVRRIPGCCGGVGALDGM